MRPAGFHFYSVNGVAESPNLWQFDAFGPEEGQMMGRAISGGTDVVIGRKLWQEWSQYWPNADASDPFGQFINPKLRRLGCFHSR